VKIYIEFDKSFWNEILVYWNTGYTVELKSCKEHRLYSRDDIL